MPGSFIDVFIIIIIIIVGLGWEEREFLGDL